MIAVVPVRDGVLPAGAEETVAECGGAVLLVGSGTHDARLELAGLLPASAGSARTLDAGVYRPGAWAAVLAHELADEPIVVLPASPDGRDLAPRLAHALDRPLLAGAVEVTPERVALARWRGLAIEELPGPARFVATLEPGVRGIEHPPAHVAPATSALATSAPATSALVDIDSTGVVDAEPIELLPPDAATMDLTEASRIVSGGGGLDSPERLGQLLTLATAWGASLGATRVVTDRGWLEHDRQIGTTGVVVHPRLYVAFAVSGAVQHTSGLGHPDHVISVNTDAHCPMMRLADLAVVADANAVLAELLARVGPPIAAGHA